MKFQDLAIVIPTLNEEHYIGALLDSIAKQTIQPKEIVVVDAESKDKTLEVIKSFAETLPQLVFYQIPKYTISRQRNLGASKTTAPHILFLDADVELKDPDTLKKYMLEIEVKKPDLAVAHNYPLSNYWKDNIFFTLTRLTYHLTKPLWPVVQAINFYVNRKTFDEVGGFNEEVKVGEDAELLHRIVKKGGKYIILQNPRIYTSVRRFATEGRRKYIWKMTKGFYYIKTKGFDHAKIEYKFGHFKKP